MRSEAKSSRPAQWPDSARQASLATRRQGAAARDLGNGKYLGKVCAKHPNLAGARWKSGRKCLGCANDQRRRRRQDCPSPDRTRAAREARAKRRRAWAAADRSAAELVERIVADIKKVVRRQERAATAAARQQEAKRRERAHWRKSPGGKLARRRHKTRRRAKLQAQRPRLNAIERAQYMEFHDLARARTAQTGTLWTVDHDKPLARGGLDHPANLMLLPHDMNSAKGARYASTFEYIAS